MPRIFSLADVHAVRDLARRAGALAVKIRDEHHAATADMGIENKPDGSPVTRADKATEEFIIEGLSKLGLAAAVVAEESVDESAIKNQPGFYLIDPIDGTRAFVNGADEFTVNIGYVAEGQPSMGVLYVPVTGETYFTEGKTAYYQQGDNAPEKITARAMNPDAVDVITNRSDYPSSRMEEFLKNYKVRNIRQLSSAHKLGLVARGEFDIYPRFVRTFEWDIAAGDAILRAAGGSVRTLDGEALRYGKPGFVNSAFVAWGKK